MQTEYNFNRFHDRNSRRGFLLEHFQEEFDNATTILDVGCSDNELKNKLGAKIFGVDIAGKPDRKVDLEKEGLSMFEDDKFDLAVCTEVLEHIDNFHDMVDELFRVSKQGVIISLPNCLGVIERIKLLFRGQFVKYYGLPLERPDDRHKWLLHATDITNFFHYYAKKHNLTIARIMYHYNYESPILKLLLRMKPNVGYCSDIFLVLKK